MKPACCHTHTICKPLAPEPRRRRHHRAADGVSQRDHRNAHAKLAQTKTPPNAHTHNEVVLQGMLANEAPPPANVADPQTNSLPSSEADPHVKTATKKPPSACVERRKAAGAHIWVALTPSSQTGALAGAAVGLVVAAFEHVAAVSVAGAEL